MLANFFYRIFLIEVFLEILSLLKKTFGYYDINNREDGIKWGYWKFKKKNNNCEGDHYMLLSIYIMY